MAGFLLYSARVGMVGILWRSPNGKFEKAATDLSLVLRSL
jgi:hypothetical protein